MTVIELQIPDDLEPALQQVPGDKQQFIIDAVRQHLSGPAVATDVDIEASAIHDLADDILTPAELSYYLNLPHVPSR